MNYEQFYHDYFFPQMSYQDPNFMMERQLPQLPNIGIGLERRVSALERQNQQLQREINRLNQVVERHTRRLNRLNQRLRAVENILRIPFSAMEDGF